LLGRRGVLVEEALLALDALGDEAHPRLALQGQLDDEAGLAPHARPPCTPKSPPRAGSRSGSGGGSSGGGSVPEDVVRTRRDRGERAESAERARGWRGRGNRSAEGG
jgi:hypothetical protein